jgi:hypothetical protein
MTRMLGFEAAGVGSNASLDWNPIAKTDCRTDALEGTMPEPMWSAVVLPWYASPKLVNPVGYATAADLSLYVGYCRGDFNPIFTPLLRPVIGLLAPFAGDAFSGEAQ